MSIAGSFRAQIGITDPPATETFFIALVVPSKNPIHFPSGEKNGARASVTPERGTASSWSMPRMTRRAVPGRIDQAGVFHGSACHETERLRDDAPPVAGATGRHGSTPEASGSSWSRASPMSRRQPPHFGRDVRRQHLPGRFLADHRHNRVGHIVAGKGSRAGQHLEQHAPEGPDVGTLVDRGQQHFDRDVAIQLRITRAVDLTHAARAEHGEDFVGTEARAGCE